MNEMQRRPSRFVPSTPPGIRVVSDASVTTRAADLEDLLVRVESMPSQRPAITHILSVLERDAAGASDLAQAVSLDPVLASKVLRLANSAYYGISGRVKTLPFAVTVVGFNAVKAIAMSSLLSNDIPAREWDMACAHAVAAGHVAPRLGAQVPDAFCAGLLADLGRSILRQLSPAGYTRLTAPITNLADLPGAELTWCGRTHQAVAAEIFAAWSFPDGIVQAVAGHHDEPRLGAEPLTIAVAAGHEIAARLMEQQTSCRLGDMTRGRVLDADFAPFSEQLRAEAEGLRTALAA